MGKQIPYVKGKTILLSAQGINICVRYFQERGHKDIKVILPAYRLAKNMSDNQIILSQLEAKGIILTTPRNSHDDIWILQTAQNNKGVIVSNDKYRQEIQNNPQFRDIVKNGLLEFRWVGVDTLMFPPDPRGTDRTTGKPFITLDDFLKA